MTQEDLTQPNRTPIMDNDPDWVNEEEELPTIKRVLWNRSRNAKTRCSIKYANLYQDGKVLGNRPLMTTRGHRPVIKTNMVLEDQSNIVKIITSQDNQDRTKSYQIKWKHKPSTWLKEDKVPWNFSRTTMRGPIEPKYSDII